MPIFLILALLLMVMVQVQVFEIAFSKLGLTPQATLAILLGTLLGSGINIPLCRLKTTITGHWLYKPFQKPVWETIYPSHEGYVVVAMNIGGCVIPVGLSLYFLSLHLVHLGNILIGLTAVTALSYKLSRPVAGVGIGMPFMIAPLLATVIALLLEPEHAAHLAYISGVLGVLIGADILNLKQVREMGTPLASIGGAGTFDGIFMTGIIAALLA